jgi:DNA-binding response OmpR family regulator
MDAIPGKPVTTVKTEEQKTWKISSPQKKRILLLDDDPAIRQVLLRLLAQEEYSVSSAADGTEALELVAAAKYDLVLLDLNAPDENGRKAFNQITAENPELPVIVITARPSQFFLALAAGIGVLLEKPLDFVKLFDTIRDLLEESPERQLKGLLAVPMSLGHIPSHGTRGMDDCNRNTR